MSVSDGDVSITRSYAATLNERDLWTLGEALSYCQARYKKRSSLRAKWKWNSIVFERIRRVPLRVVSSGPSENVTMDPQTRLHLSRQSTYMAVIDDVDLFVIERVLEHYREACQKQLAKDASSPLWARDEDIESVRRKFRVATSGDLGWDDCP